MTWGTSWLAKMGRFLSVVKSGSRRHKFGQVAFGYTGTVTFACDDAAAELPPDYRFQPGDQGHAVFSVTLNTSGPVHLTVTDTGDDTVFAALDLIVL